MDFPAHDSGLKAVSISQIRYPAGRYAHPPSGLFQLRIVRGGSSYAEIDLGAGLRHVFTRPGDMLLSLGDKPTFFSIAEARDLTFVQAGAEHANQLLEMLGASIDALAPLVDRPFRDPVIAGLSVRMQELNAAPQIREWAFGLMLALLLDMAQSRRETVSARRLSPQQMTDLRAAIEARLERSITVAELAAAAGIHERAFSAAFREATGLPVYQFVLRRRVERAVELLQSTDMPLTAVAQHAGFTHQAHMTRVLKRLKGTTPNQIRKNG